MKSILHVILFIASFAKSYGIELISTTSQSEGESFSYKVCVIESGDVPSIVLVFKKDNSELVLTEMLCKKANIKSGDLVKQAGEWYFVWSDGDKQKAFHLDLDHLNNKISVKSVDMSDPKMLADLLIGPQSRFDAEEEIVKRIKGGKLRQR